MKLAKIQQAIAGFARQKTSKQMKETITKKVFWAIVRKEFTDFLSSWRIIILLGIILLTCVGSLYTAVTTIQDAINSYQDGGRIGRNSYLFLQMFTISDGNLPSFLSFVSFLGPLLGIALGFDAINSERSKGTLSRLMAQPIPRDYVINAKFVAALFINIVLFIALGMLVMAFGILILGIPPSIDEFLRVISFLFLILIYIAFWINLAILFSVIFRQQATSALSSMALWLFFLVFYSMIVKLLTNSYLEEAGSTNEYVSRYNAVLNIYRFSPNYLFQESTTVLLSPTVRSTGLMTMEQVTGSIASPLVLKESLLLIWPQLTGLIAATLVCFAIAYVLFMRQEIRSN
ncbi:ABC transporter permease [Halalkalibacterium halodurans]|nr:ABC transporter permease [Halalkalibacterium halodurans]MED3647185.1 ABC transporter permease [Halalkalibacterium halodurans]MED4162419.1 ABC transporter permease [Halalkalibacterium halodurans]TPE69860.1 ABC transporter permease [Halalkalibacterium halodurans]